MRARRVANLADHYAARPLPAIGKKFRYSFTADMSGAEIDRGFER